MLEVAFVVLAVVCLLLGGCCLWLARNQRQLTQLQAERDALHQKKLRDLTKCLDIYLAGSVRIGEELHELRRVMAPLPDKLQQLEQRDPGSLSYTQAARLVGLGASVEDLTQSCGLSRAEAELVNKLHRARPQQP
ncbi:MAG: DUF2802 domain-containing protein [Pseudomonas sp.]